MKTCCKCKKKLKEKEVVEGYGDYFCKICYEEFRKQEKEEIERFLKKY